MGHYVECRPVDVVTLAATRIAESTDTGVDKLGIAGAHDFVRKAQPVEHAGAKVLHHHICLVDQRQQHFFALGCLEVEHHAFFIAVDALEIAPHGAHGVVAEVGAEGAREVAIG